MNLSNPKRQLVTPDPDTSNYIPVDDRSWDNGVINMTTLLPRILF